MALLTRQLTVMKINRLTVKNKTANQIRFFVSPCHISLKTHVLLILIITLLTKDGVYGYRIGNGKIRDK